MGRIFRDDTDYRSIVMLTLKARSLLPFNSLFRITLYICFIKRYDVFPQRDSRVGGSVSLSEAHL